MMKSTRWLTDGRTRELGILRIRMGVGGGLMYHGSGKLFGNMAGFVEGVA